MKEPGTRVAGLRWDIQYGERRERTRGIWVHLESDGDINTQISDVYGIPEVGIIVVRLIVSSTLGQPNIYPRKGKSVPACKSGGQKHTL